MKYQIKEFLEPIKRAIASKASIIVLVAIFVVSFLGITLSAELVRSQNSLALLQPAPLQSQDYYDYFGKSLNAQEAAVLVSAKGLNPNDPTSYQKIGAVHVTKDLIAQGEKIFFEREIGDPFGLQGVFGFGEGLQIVLPEVLTAIGKLQGQPTANLQITLLKDITLGSQTLSKGTTVNTGFKVEKGGSLPIGLTPNLGITCALCHTGLSSQGKAIAGIPNGELAIPLLISLAPNTAAGFARLNFNPLDPKYQGDGKIIIDSKGKQVRLADPQKLEKAFDDAVLAVPVGHFESSPDSISNTTQIPTVFTFKTHPYGADGNFAVGPFAGLTAINNGVHSSEINLFAAAQLSEKTLGIDPEVYLGTLLQNAANLSLRLPDGAPVKPSVWLRTIFPDPSLAELENQIAVPGAGTYPNLKPSLFTYNGLAFSPNTGNPKDIASGTFLFAANAMSAFQNNLVPPANQTAENLQALNTGSVSRGAEIFKQAQCTTCHIPPFFTDNKIHPIDNIKTNPARAQSRLGLKSLLVPPKIYTLNTSVPIVANAQVLDVPTTGISDTPTTLPIGLLPKGGYKSTPLRGLHLTPPYLHDGGVAVRAGSLQIGRDGNFRVVDPSGLGLTGTLSQLPPIPADAASSLRALVDRNLRSFVIKANRAYPALGISNLDGTGHEFYVDRSAGFSPRQQADLVNFLLALDNDPGKF